MLILYSVYTFCKCWIKRTDKTTSRQKKKKINRQTYLNCICKTIPFTIFYPSLRNNYVWTNATGRPLGITSCLSGASVIFISTGSLECILSSGSGKSTLKGVWFKLAFKFSKTAAKLSYWLLSVLKIRWNWWSPPDSIQLVLPNCNQFVNEEY